MKTIAYVGEWQWADILQLQMSEHCIKHYRSGNEALDELLKKEFDIILVEARLAVCTSEEILEEKNTDRYGLSTIRNKEKRFDEVSCGVIKQIRHGVNKQKQLYTVGATEKEKEWFPELIQAGADNYFSLSTQYQHLIDTINTTRLNQPINL